MLHRFIIILIAYPLSTQLFAEPKVVCRPLYIHHDSIQRLNTGIDLIPFADILVDSFNNYAIGEVIKSSEFVPLETFEFDSKYIRGRYAYWMRFSIENTLEDTVQFSFFCGKFDSLILFKQSSLEDQFGKMVKSNQNQKNRSNLVNASIIQLSPRESSEYYIRIRNTPGIPRYISPVIIYEKALLLNLLIAANDRWYILYFELGALLIMLLYFFTQLLLKQSKLLLYYTSYLLFMLIHLSRSILMSHPTAQFYPPRFYDYFFMPSSPWLYSLAIYNL